VPRENLAVVSDAERLEIQAAKLDTRADQLAAEVAGLRREAVELRLTAGRLERSPLRVVRDEPARRRPRRPHSYGAQIRDAARELDTFQVSALRAQLPHVGINTVYRWVKTLTNEGVLERQGRGYRYVAANALRDRAGEAMLRVWTKGTPARELHDREVAWTTEAPA